MNARTYLRIVNNFFHDLASGMWAACVLVVFLLAIRRVGVPAEAAAALQGVGVLMFWLAVGSLGVIVGTGVLRTLYWRSQHPADELPQWRRALFVKHALYVTVYAGGTFAAWIWAG